LLFEWQYYDIVIWMWKWKSVGWSNFVASCNNCILNIHKQLWYFLFWYCSENESGKLYFHFDICEMTARKDKRRLLKENRVFFLRLLEVNNTVKFPEPLYEQPNFIHACYCLKIEVCFWWIFISCEIVFNICWNCRTVANWVYFIWLQNEV